MGVVAMVNPALSKLARPTSVAPELKVFNASCDCNVAKSRKANVYFKRIGW